MNLLLLKMDQNKILAALSWVSRKLIPGVTHVNPKGQIVWECRYCNAIVISNEHEMACEFSKRCKKSHDFWCGYKMYVLDILDELKNEKDH